MGVNPEFTMKSDATENGGFEIRGTPSPRFKGKDVWKNKPNVYICVFFIADFDKNLPFLYTFAISLPLRSFIL